MATPWVILSRLIRAEHVVEAAATPDFTLPVAPPPVVTILAAGRGAPPDPDRPDRHPYIIAAAPHCLLAHFGVAPSIGASLDDNPDDTHLVMVRQFHRADGVTTASAEHVPDRVGAEPVLSNIGSVGLISEDEGSYRIVELQVDDIGVPVTLVSFEFVLDFDSGVPVGLWSWEYMECPLPAEDQQARGWAPHGAVSLESTLWWFDLRWAILSCDLSDPEQEPELVFHRLPDGSAPLEQATPLMFAQRCVTVSQGQLRYVEIIYQSGDADNDSDDDGEDYSEAATVSLWTRVVGPEGWRWDEKYTVSFEEIWNDNSYRDAGLPRFVPALAVVCPSDPDLVYFTLGRLIFGVNVPARRVVHHEAYHGLVNNARLEPHGRNLLAWVLPPAGAAGPAGV